MRQLQTTDVAMMPAHEFPFWARNYAAQNGNLHKVLFVLKGGLGDQVSQVPAVHYVRKLLREQTLNKYFVYTDFPDLFSGEHWIEKVFTYPDEVNKFDYHYIELNYYQSEAAGMFLNPLKMNPVEHAMVCATRGMSPIKDREINLPHFTITYQVQAALAQNNAVVVHAGAHWETKTFPAKWYNHLLKEFIKKGFTPVLVGKTNLTGRHGKTGYVDVDNTGCVDLRDKLSLQEFITIGKHARFIFSNDSAIIHIAASGNAFIGFVANPKEADFLKHWRRGIYGWNTESFEVEGFWDYMPITPQSMNTINVEHMPPGLNYNKVLPPPSVVVARYEMEREKFNFRYQ